MEPGPVTQSDRTRQTAVQPDEYGGDWLGRLGAELRAGPVGIEIGRRGEARFAAWRSKFGSPVQPDWSQAALARAETLGARILVRQWMPIRPVQPYFRASAASRRIRPTQSCGMVRPGSSSIQGMAHFGRPWTLANPGSTGVLPTSRLMQLIGMSFGSNSSNSDGFCGGPSTQPQVASVNGGLTFFAAAIAARRSASVASICSCLTACQVQPSGVQSQ